MPTLYEWAGGEKAFGRLIMRSISTAALVAMALTLGACFGGDDDKPAASLQPPKCTPAPGTPTSVNIEPKWSVGDTRSVRISKSREETGEEASESSATANLRVVGVAQNGARLQWRSTDLVLPDDQLPDDAKNRLRDAAKDFEVVYSTDTGGEYRRKQNVAAIRDQLTRVLDLLEEDPTQAESVARTRPIILSDAFIQTSVVKEIPMLHSAYGLKLAEGRPQRITRVIPNPFGGAALEAKGTAELVEARDENGCAVVELDVKPSRAALTDSLTKTFGGDAEDVPAAAKRAGIGVHDTSRVLYDPGTGWVVRVDFTQSVTISGNNRSDIAVITTRE